MASKADKVMVDCMRYMRNADPKVHDLFTSALTEYAQELTVAVTTCPLAEVMEARGRAQAALKFLELFSTRLNQPTSP